MFIVCYSKFAVLLYVNFDSDCCALLLYIFNCSPARFCNVVISEMCYCLFAKFLCIVAICDRCLVLNSIVALGTFCGRLARMYAAFFYILMMGFRMATSFSFLQQSLEASQHLTEFVLPS